MLVVVNKAYFFNRNDLSAVKEVSNLINIAFLIKYNLVMLEGQLIFLAAGIINLEVVIYYF